MGFSLVSLTQLQEIPSKNLILLIGPPSSGKTTFCQQVTLQSLAMEKPTIYITTKYGPSRVEIALKERGMLKIDPELLYFIDAYEETVGVSVSDRPDTVHADCNDLSSIDISISKLNERIGKKKTLLIFDSLTSPYLFNGSEILRFITQTMSRFSAQGNAVLACIDEGCGRSEDLVSMMSLSDGVIRIEMLENQQIFNLVKHPKVELTRITIPIESKPGERRFEIKDYDPDALGEILVAIMKGEQAILRPEVGDFVNLFWPTLIHWGGMLWDPIGFPSMKYYLNKEEESNAQDVVQFFPWHWKLFIKFYSKIFAPKNLSRVNDMKRAIKRFYGQFMRQECSAIVEYLEDISKTNEHYIRVYENVDCCGFENVGAPMGLYLSSIIAGKLEGSDSMKREWNAIETKCVGLGDPYCELKIVPGKIKEINKSLAKDSLVAERIHQQVTNRLMGFLLKGKPLVERPTLGSEVHFHVVWHFIGFPYLVGERYQIALRMGGAKVGKEIGEHIIEEGIETDEAISRILNFLNYCKVGIVGMDKTITIKDNIESSYTKSFKTKAVEPACYFTTGFLNGFFSTVKNQHVKETKCIAMGDPYCEWEFR